MKKTVVTMTRTYHINRRGEETGDSFLDIVSEGYEKSDAFFKALQALKYGCCDDFTNPSSCQSGYCVETFSCEAFQLEPSDSDETIENLDDGVECFDFDGKKFAVSWDEIDQAKNSGTLRSDDIRAAGEWPETF